VETQISGKRAIFGNFGQFWPIFSFLFCSLTTPEKQRLGVTATRIVLASIFDAAIH
jgi:hypothetical protein